MKKIFNSIALFLLFSSNTVLACYLESADGKPVEPQILHLGTATMVNENGNQIALITCGKFDGTFEGLADRKVELQIGECTIISNNGQMNLIKCDE